MRECAGARTLIRSDSTTERATVAAMTITEAKTVVELTAGTITSFLDAHSNGITVVDYFTTWCGPCKVRKKAAAVAAGELW